MGSSLTAHEAATFYSSAMNTQQIINSRRQPKRFAASSTVGTANGPGANSAGSANGNNSNGGVNNMGMGATQLPMGQKVQATKYKSNNSPTGFTKTFY